MRRLAATILLTGMGIGIFAMMCVARYVAEIDDGTR